MFFPNLKNEDPTLLKITTKDEKNRELKYKTEKQDHEIILNSLKSDREFYKHKYKSLKKDIFKFH